MVSLTVTQARLRQAAEGADKHTGHGVCCVCPSPPRDAAVLNRVIARQDASHNMTDGEIDPEKLLAFLQQVGGLFAQEKQRQHVMSLGPSTTLAQGKSAPEPHNVPTVTASVHMPDALHVLELFHTFTQKGLKQLKSLEMERGQIKAPHTNREAMCKAICQWQLAEYVKGLSANAGRHSRGNGSLAFAGGAEAVRSVAQSLASLSSVLADAHNLAASVLGPGLVPAAAESPEVSPEAGASHNCHTNDGDTAYEAYDGANGPGVRGDTQGRGQPREDPAVGAGARASAGAHIDAVNAEAADAPPAPSMCLHCTDKAGGGEKRALVVAYADPWDYVMDLLWNEFGRPVCLQYKTEVGTDVMVSDEWLWDGLWEASLTSDSDTHTHTHGALLVHVDCLVMDCQRSIK